jgi:hypothetical protein
MNTEINESEIIKKARPTLKPTTIAQYVGQLNQLKKIFESKDYSFLKDFDLVVDKLKDKHFTTQRNFYNSIIVLLTALDENKELISKYVDLRDKLNEEYNDSLSSKISEKQKSNFASMKEINDMLDSMEKEVKQKRLKTKGNLTGKEKEVYMMYVIYSMLKTIPTRNDIAGMVLTVPRDYHKQSKDFNYLVMGRDTLYYMINNFKTNKTYGIDKRIDVPIELSKIIRPFLRATKKKSGDVIFTTSTGNPISRNVLSQMLLKTSKKYIGKSVSTNMMRKIVVSHELGALKKKQTELADKMMHSVATQNAVYIKDTD